MENPQEFLNRNLEELKALQIGEVKVIDGVKLKGSKCGCEGCTFRSIDCIKLDVNCMNKSALFGFEEVDENDNLKNECELNSLENE